MEAFEKKKFEGGGQDFKSSVVLIIIVSDLRNRMALSDFENSKYFTSYGQFKLKFPWKPGFFSLKKVLHFLSKVECGID